MKKNNVFKEIAKGLVVTVMGFVLMEALLRIAYFGRNWLVTEIPLTYLFGEDHGPIPPWLDDLRILEPDKVLIWKNRPNIQQRYVDFFSPAHSEKEKTTILRRFLPQSPDSVKGNPTWEISLNSEGFRDKSYNATWREQVTGNDFEKFEPWMRDSLRDYDRCHREMIRVARSRNISIVLLYNEFWKDSPYLKVLQRISRDEGVPLVDSSALLAGAQKSVEEELEKKIRPSTSQGSGRQRRWGNRSCHSAVCVQMVCAKSYVHC
jgi:hypothetical protein